MSIQNDTAGQFPEAQDARRRVMSRQLMRLGFSEEQSTAAILHYSSVKQAADSLLATRCKRVGNVIFREARADLWLLLYK